MTDKPNIKRVRMTDKGWALVMDLGLMKDGADLEEIAKESGEPFTTLLFMRALAQFSLEDEDKE